MRRLPMIVATAALVALPAACGGSAKSSSTPAKQGDGSTADLASKIQSAKLGCADYKDVPQNPDTFSRAGVRDIGNCDLGHLAVFDSAKARDQWTASQVRTAKMRDCVTGQTWAVCMFPSIHATDANVRSALKGASTS